MAGKRIIVSINHTPHGTAFFSEGLRAAAGASEGLDAHKVDVVLLGDGVFCALKGVDRSSCESFLAKLHQHGSKLYCEEESVRARGLERADLADDIIMIPRSQVAALFQEADLSIDF